MYTALLTRVLCRAVPAARAAVELPTGIQRFCTSPSLGNSSQGREHHAVPSSSPCPPSIASHPPFLSLRTPPASAAPWISVQPCPGSSRLFSSSAADHSKEVEEINSMFVEARDEIEYAQEDADTVYFNDSVAEAKEVVDKCLDKWKALLSRLPAEESQKLQRSMGLKMEQLKAEFEVLRKTHLEE